MQHNANWFYNFFNGKDNWCRGARIHNGRYCAIGHLQSHEGVSDEILSLREFTHHTPLVMECANSIFNGLVSKIWETNDLGIDPKLDMLKACRRAILKENPYCELGKEYDECLEH